MATDEAANMTNETNLTNLANKQNMTDKADTANEADLTDKATRENMADEPNKGNEESEQGSPSLLRAVIEEAGYEAGHPIVRNIVLDVRSGERVGLIGPNGAGKSTLMKGLLGQLPHWRAQVYWRGEEEGNAGEGLHSAIAYIPEQPIVYERLTLWEHLVLAAASAGLSEDELNERADKLLRRFRLSGFRHHYPVKFSKGMQQKTMLIVAFLLKPDLYLVDEPFIGLDPGAVLELIDALEEERSRGAAVLMTTHVLDSAERMCDRFVLVSDGGAAASGTLEEIAKQAGFGPDARLFDCFHRLASREDEVEA
ncbi:ABC-2 type transport system ATP-binding protein [Cohnella sp. SGD-V74]|uniref:ABC transporter ATP-binding protein n=1 Tax=unclassified Cohnella TaxID=2636738 RepID=UPI000D49CC92|nr:MULTISPECIES: ABC transporter ATP-binding protein [unclassified Cohnella]PRX69647.1 ABC-2 type transport system ATP-binding protein [Cohnella sp. SGD-V74]